MAERMELLHDGASLVAWSERARADRLRVGLVPTMGFLHRGHVSLMERLRPRVDRLVVSIYVNPLQFGVNEDLSRYPRDVEGDLARCREAGVDAVFLPESLYPPGFATEVRVSGLTDGLCGAARPTHFAGVTTVVARLFGLSRCDEACFGEKDWQQLVVIRRMAEDLAIPVRIVPGPLVRDDDGLALSSRNVYLSAPDRLRATSLYRALSEIRRLHAGGERDVQALTAAGRARLEVDSVDYLEIVDALSLTPLTSVAGSARALVAARVGGTRLIDNVAVGAEVEWT